MPILRRERRRYRTLAVAALVVTSTIVAAVCPKHGLRPGAWPWSRLAVDLCFQNEDAGTRTLEIPSPDKSKVLVVAGDKLSLRLGKKELDIGAASASEEVIWSPDSSGMIFTSSFGAAGPDSVNIVVVDQDGTINNLSNVTETIRSDFKSRHSSKNAACVESVNVGGLTWTGRSKAVLVAEIPPSPGCGLDAGYFEAYIVSVPEGKIRSHYTMEETARRWSRTLGKRLRDDLTTFRQNRKDRQHTQWSRQPT